MKKYYNKTKGEWYNENSIITRKVENGLFSGVPTLEQLTEWGFEEWIEPEEPYEQQLQKAKDNKIIQIDQYNDSPEVNSFTVNGYNMWLTVSERQQIATQISANEAIGRDTMTKWYDGQQFTFTLDQWKQMLVLVEVYAGDALNVTEQHKAAVMALDTVEAVNAYDYTKGYPNKLNF